MAKKRALSVGVARFDRHEQLDFAPVMVARLGQALERLGYDVRESSAASLSGDELGALVTETLDAGEADDLAIVHLVSHGENAAGDATVFALGTDGDRHANADIAHWLTMRQEVGPTTLFLLDLCASGTAARLPWQTRVDNPRGWVIAACGPGESAFDGRFTQAVTNVLQALHAEELDIDPGTPYVPLSTVARAIRQEVNRLAESTGDYRQQVTASLVDLSADHEPAFFPNPAYRPSDRQRLRTEVDPGMRPFLDDLDEGLDARHFVERASGLGTAAGTVGCFTGRDRELRRISPWLNGHGDGQDGADGPLYVVTGSPGSGKSALLGVLVCAANRDLREDTRPIWNRGMAPGPIRDLVAVHARQRGPAAVAASIARQLVLPENLGAEELVSALRTPPRRPVVVVDALDEADDPGRIMTDLLLPLVAKDEPGTPVRLLVGVRRYDEYAPLFAHATMVDLDDNEPEVLENDLFNYVVNLMRATCTYRAKGGVIGEFAHAVANALVASSADGTRRWGPFLVAGLYTRHFVAAYTGPMVTDPELAAKLGREVPADLLGVLDLELTLQKDQPWLRPVMTALAHARGIGMPVSLLARTVPVFADNGGRPSVADIRSALTAGKFYLRQSLDTDQSNVYRLFHQGLADTLRRPSRTGDLLDAMLSGLGPSGARDWNAAEPYLFRHVTDHAADAGQLAELETDPGLLLHPGFAAHTLGGWYAGITDPATLALAATRLGDTGLAHRAANLTGREPLTWQPHWTIGAPGPDWTTTSVGPASSVAIHPDGTLVTAVGPRGCRTWSWPVDGPPTSSQPFTSVNGNLVLVPATGGTAIIRGKTLLQWHDDGWVRTDLGDTVATVIDDGQDLVLATATGAIVRRKSDYEAHHQYFIGHPAKAYALGIAAHDVVVLTVSGERCLLYDPVEREFPAPFQVTAFALSRNGMTIALGDESGEVICADRTSHKLSWRTAWLVDSEVTALAFSPDGTGLAIGCKDGSVHNLNLTGPGSWRAHLSDVPITTVARSGSPARLVAIDLVGDVHWATPEGSGRLLAELADEEPPWVTFVTAVVRHEDDLVIGMTDGSLSTRGLADGSTGELGVLTGGQIRDIALPLVGNELATLVATTAGYYLFAMGKDITLEPSSEWAAKWFRPHPRRPCIELDGRLVEVVNAGDTLLFQPVDGHDTIGLGHHPGCATVHCAYVEGRPTAFTGGTDGVLRVWDLQDREATDTVHIGRPIWRIDTHEHRLLVAAGGELLCFEHVSLRYRPPGASSIGTVGDQ